MQYPRHKLSWRIPILKDILRGRHSNIPWCCIAFFATFWQFPQLRKAYHRFSAAVELFDSTEYIQCPKCVLLGPHNQLFHCTPECMADHGVHESFNQVPLEDQLAAMNARSPSLLTEEIHLELTYEDHVALAEMAEILTDSPDRLHEVIASQDLTDMETRVVFAHFVNRWHACKDLQEVMTVAMEVNELLSDACPDCT